MRQVWFENDVKMYGIQTGCNAVCHSVQFENDVKMYGIQTLTVGKEYTRVFENDVKMYGIQTKGRIESPQSCLRMM